MYVFSYEETLPAYATDNLLLLLQDQIRKGMFTLHKLGYPAVTWFLPKKFYSSGIPISADTLTGRQKTKHVSPSQSDIAIKLEPKPENQQSFKQVSTDLIDNVNITSVDPKFSKTFPALEPSTQNNITDNNIVLPPCSMNQIPSTTHDFSSTLISVVTSKVSTHQVDYTKAVVDVDRQQEELLKLALPFDEVPGPTVLKFLAKISSYLPLVGTQITAGAMMYFLNMLGSNLIWNRTARPFIHMFDKYGPIVRLQGLFGGNIVFVSRPEHIKTVFQQEGHYPVRSSLDSIEMYRMKHRKMHILDPLMSGHDWEILRSKLKIPLEKSINHYHDEMENIANEMVIRIHTLRNRQEEVPATFNDEIYKWALENVCMVALGKQLGLLDPTGLSITSESIRLLKAAQDASHALRGCESGFQLWRFFETKNWRTFVSSCDVIDSIAAKYIRIAQSCIQNKNSDHCDNQQVTPLLESLLLAEEMLPDDILTIVLDMFLIGVNVTSHALSFFLYHLSKNPRAQRNVYDELLKVMPTKDSPLSYSSLQQLPYLHACLKESLRLQPPIPVITRVLPNDIALHSYKIPKGTHMLMTNHVMSLREENFEDAHKFKPERWLLDEEDIHSVAAIPFGHGPRSCVDKGLTEIQLWLTIAKVLRNFHVEYHYGTIQASTRFIAMPRKPLKLRFVERAK